jgi:molecular chaperone HscB
MLDAVDRDLRAQWAIWDAGDAVARPPAQRAMVALLDRRRFLSNLVRDMNEILGD